MPSYSAKGFDGVKPQSSLSKPKTAGHASDDAHFSELLASLELNLSNLVTARDPQTVKLAYELQNAIDNIRAELGQIGGLAAFDKRDG